MYMKANSNKPHLTVEEKDKAKCFRIVHRPNCLHHLSQIQIRWTPSLKLPAKKRRLHLRKILRMVTIALNKMNKTQNKVRQILRLQPQRPKGNPISNLNLIISSLSAALGHICKELTNRSR